MNRVVDRASRVQLQEDRMVLQLFPQDFVVDDHPGHRDPRKMLASRLEINVHLVTASVQEHNSLDRRGEPGALAVEETVFEALAACYAAVLPEERREGIAVVDIGAQSTELVVYYGDAMHLASTVDLRRPFHARSGPGPVPQLRRCRDGEAGVRLRGLERHVRRTCSSSCRRPRIGERREVAAQVRQPHSGSARDGAVPACARANWRAWAWTAR